MEVQAWSDASFKDGVTGAVSIIMADNLYLGTKIARYRTLTPYDAEMLGVIQVLEFVKQEAIVFSKLVINTDSKAIAEKYEEICRLSVENVAIPPKSIGKWKRLLDLTEGRNVHIQYTEGHQFLSNPNKFCDVAARIVVEEGS